jgi:O-6-methylguanine DNA methyltransferase
MNTMLSKSALSRTPQSRHVSAAVEALFYGTSDCDLGKVLVARSADGVCAISLGNDPAALRSDLQAHFPDATLIASDAIVRDDLAKVTRFIGKPAEGLHLTLDMRGTALQRRIWEKMRTIPVGRTVTYTEIARWIGPFSARVIGGACAANPIALAIPCHRVIRTDGDLSGYRWGIERKRALIRREAEAA